MILAIDELLLLDVLEEMAVDILA